jgi:hypothetical protein
MKLKTLILLERGMSMGYGSMSSNDTELRPMPGSADDVEDWDGIKEGNGWFLYRETNNHDTKRSGASVYITEEDKPHKYWMKIKTHGLRKAGDTNKMYYERVKKHTDKVSKAWISEASKLHKASEFNEVGNKKTISWKQAFKEALSSPKIKNFIENSGEEEIAPLADPVNFTPRV